jgi:hypothetical protein
MQASAILGFRETVGFGLGSSERHSLNGIGWVWRKRKQPHLFRIVLSQSNAALGDRDDFASRRVDDGLQIFSLSSALNDLQVMP